MADLAYTTMKADFKTFMDATMLGATTNTFREVIGFRDLRNAQAAMFNGAYLIKWNGLKSVDEKPQVSGYMWFYVNMTLQVGFVLNQNETNATTEKAAVNDIETIIQKRVLDTSFPTGCEDITCDGATPFEYINESFAISDINFLVKFRVTL